MIASGTGYPLVIGSHWFLKPFDLLSYISAISANLLRFICEFSLPILMDIKAT